MVSLGKVEENRQLVKGQSFEFPVLAWEDMVPFDYQVPGTPFFYMINGEGLVVNKGSALTRWSI